MSIYVHLITQLFGEQMKQLEKDLKQLKKIQNQAERVGNLDEQFYLDYKTEYDDMSIQQLYSSIDYFFCNICQILFNGNTLHSVLWNEAFSLQNHASQRVLNHEQCRHSVARQIGLFPAI